MTENKDMEKQQEIPAEETAFEEKAEAVDTEIEETAEIQEKAESEEHVKALLIRITINCSKSLLSSSWFKRTEPLSENLSVSDEVSDTLDAVLRLSQKYRTVIHLHYYMGYSVEEIAHILKSKPSTVKSQLHRARQKLKIELEGESANV